MSFHRVFTICSLLILSTLPVSAADIRAYLYNPAEDSSMHRFPYPHEAEKVEYHPFLVMAGVEVPEGAYQLRYAIMRDGQALVSGECQLKTMGQLFATEIKLQEKFPAAQAVRWELKQANSVVLNGSAPLRWSRFHGRVKYRDSQIKQTAYVELSSWGFGAPGVIRIPVTEDGRFDAMVPARVYKVVNINSTGYKYNAMERWGWDYDLNQDREDEFTIGRTEIYGMHAFKITGGPSTILVAFRPTALSRVLRFDADNNGRLDDQESEKMSEALKNSFTAIGPELKADNVKAWVDGKACPVSQLNMLPEFDGNGSYQVLYLAQLYLGGPLKPGESHEIKIEVESEEELRGQKIKDWGQGSVGYYPTIL
jgi:hypothetical protein